MRLIKLGALKTIEGVWFICVNGRSHAEAALPTAHTGWGAGRAPQHVWALRTVIAYRIDAQEVKAWMKGGECSTDGISETDGMNLLTFVPKPKGN